MYLQWRWIQHLYRSMDIFFIWELLAMILAVIYIKDTGNI